MINSIQWFRAIAAWVVVFHHFMQIFYSFESETILGKLFARYGSLGVDLFFVISGFVIHRSSLRNRITPRSFLIGRVARIAPAYWIFTLGIALILLVWPEFYPLSSYDVSFLLKSLLFIPANNPGGIGILPLLTIGWTLNFEALFYLVFGLTLFLPRSLRFLGLAFGITLAYIVLPHFDHDFSFYHNPIIFEFLLGVLISIAYVKGTIDRIPRWLAALLVVLASIAILLFARGHSLITAGIPIALIVVAGLSQEKHLRRVPLFNILGDWSYSTYLTHVPVLLLGYYAWQAWNLPPMMVLGASCFLIILISWLSFQLLETKASNWIKNMLGGADSAQRGRVSG